jgi:hypothetical protein
LLCDDAREGAIDVGIVPESEDVPIRILHVVVPTVLDLDPIIPAAVILYVVPARMVLAGIVPPMSWVSVLLFEIVTGDVTDMRPFE